MEQDHKKYSTYNLLSPIRGLYLITFFFYSHCFGQISYELTIPLPPKGTQIERISETYYGTYSSQQSDVDYEFSDQGLFVVSMIYSTISRETIRESSKFKVNSGWLIGIKENDSVEFDLVSGKNGINAVNVKLL